MPKVGNPSLQTLTVANAAKKIAPPNTNRVRFWFQNQGPGNVWLAPQDNTPNQQGFLVLPNASFVDDPPCAHDGEWWAITDTANTNVAVSETT